MTPDPIEYLSPPPPEEASDEQDDYFLSFLSPAPEQSSTIFGIVWFTWLTPLLNLGYEKPLDSSDLSQLQSSDTSRKLTRKISKFLDPCLKLTIKESKPQTVSLAYILVRAFLATLTRAGLFKLCSDLLALAQPLFLSLLLSYAQSYNIENVDGGRVYQGMVVAVVMLATSMVQSACLQQHYQSCFRLGLKVNSGLINQIYIKSLRLSATSRRVFAVGEITNLQAVDAARLGSLAEYVHNIWSAPLVISICVYLLYSTLGASVYGGVMVMVLMIPLNAVLATKSKKLQSKQMLNKDKRQKLMDELLSGIKVIKLNSWQETFAKKIDSVRETELKNLMLIARLHCWSSLSWSITPYLVSLITFTIYSFIETNSPLTSSKIFVSLALFNLLRFPLTSFPTVITALVEAIVSLRRISLFLNAEERQDYVVYRDDNDMGIPVTEQSSNFKNIKEPKQENLEKTRMRLEIIGGKFTWLSLVQQPVLSDINLRIYQGQLTAIVGPVGAGKSTLISAILGDLYAVEGKVVVNGRVAYVAQTAWILNATVRDNILFGRIFDSKRYERVVETCALVDDFHQFSSGDHTVIGEKGITLSGGQKQRISIARAVYADADLYLLDDCLSAVDPHVSEHIFENVFGKQGILKGKARVLVTHAIQHLSACDIVVVLKQGMIVEQGSYEELMENQGVMHKLINEFGRLSPNKNSPETDNPKTRRVKKFKSQDADPVMTKQRSMIMNTEVSEKGKVSFNVYLGYAKACHLVPVTIFILLAIATQGVRVVQDLLLSNWADANDHSLTGGTVSPLTWLSMYFLIGILYSIFVFLQVIIAWVICGIRASRTLHSDLLTTILHLPQQFFDMTPTGYIINRFSKDLDMIDDQLPRSFLLFFRTLFTVLAIISVNTIGNPYYILFALPLGYIYIKVQAFYIATSRQLKRIDSNSRAPILAHFSETLVGVATIRAFSKQNDFIKTSQSRIDANSRAYYLSNSCNRWLATRLGILGAIVVFSSAVFGVLALHYRVNGMTPAVFGLMLVYSMSITQNLIWWVRQSSEIETNIVSVERINQYLALEREAAWNTENDPPAEAEWPSVGEIDFVHYSARYRADLGDVLKDIDVFFRSGEKTAIVGRTGAGKSSLIMALFRLIDASEGKITIDGVDISTIGLSALRSGLSIIPQDAFMFSGTIRLNIDPLGKVDDHAIWLALDQATMKSTVAAFPLGLDSEVYAGGENFSAGERQLFCLARALVRKKKIVVFDEATASIDVETDDIIQKVIRKEMKGCTILCIAHRIHTVLDSDRILVLDGGKVVEYAPPQVLLKDSSSVFYSLVNSYSPTEENSFLT